MARHTYYLRIDDESSAGAKDAVLWISDFRPFGGTSLSSDVVEFRINASSPWVTAGRFFKPSNAVPYFFSSPLYVPLATASTTIAIAPEVRINGGVDGQWLLFNGNIQSYETAPREISITTGSEIRVRVDVDVTLTNIVAEINNAQNFNIAMYPIDCGIDGGALAGADGANPATNDARKKTFAVFNEPTSELEVHRQGTGTNGTTLLIHFTNLLTDSMVPAPPEDFDVNETIVNATSNGASDGSIALVVSSGVSPFSFLWSDNGATTPSRTGLAAGVYEVQITDDGNISNVKTFNFTITEPSEIISPYKNSRLESSPINPIRFKNDEGTIDGVSVHNNADNVNYCEEAPEAWNSPPSYELFNVAETTKIQFRTDFENTSLEVLSNQGVTLGSIPLNIVVNNIDSLQEQPGFVRDHGGGQIRVYPSSKELANGTAVGGNLEIDSLSNDYDGDFEIQAVLFDSALNSPFVVVVAAYTANENVDIKYLNALDYNIAEATISMATLGNGIWKLVLRGHSAEGTKTLVSEWIRVAPKTLNTLVFTYKNLDNAYGIDWSTGIEMKIRVYGFFSLSKPSRDQSTHRNSNDVPQVLNAYVRRQRQMNLHQFPWFAIERMALIMSCDYFTINGKEYFSDELPEFESSERYALSKAVAIVEQKNWINDQNRHDAGSEVSILGLNSEEEVLGL